VEDDEEGSAFTYGGAGGGAGSGKASAEHNQYQFAIDEQLKILSKMHTTDQGVLSTVRPLHPCALPCNYPATTMQPLRQLGSFLQPRAAPCSPCNLSDPPRLLCRSPC
jgi:hypothetical protein